MIRKEQDKILDAKIESNVNQYKVDRLNAEISAFSSGDLNKYEFLTRKDLKYKPNALDKATFEFSPLGQTFSTGLDKTDLIIIDQMMMDMMMEMIMIDQMMMEMMTIDQMMMQMMIINQMIMEMMIIDQMMMEMFLLLNTIIYCLNIIE